MQQRLLIAVPLLLGLAAAPAAASRTGGSSAEAERFAHEVSARARLGWRLADLAIAEGEHRLALSITLARGAAAERYTLSFSPDGGTVTGYRRRAAAVPRERRVYHGADDLLAALSQFTPSGFYAECGAYVLEGGGTSVSVQPSDYHVVSARARGARAPRLLAAALDAALADGEQLTAVTDSDDLPAHAARALDFVLADEGGGEVVHVGLDEQGRVLAVEVRSSPKAAEGWAQSYRAGPALARALRGGAVRALHWTPAVRPGGEPSLVATLAGGGSVAIDLADFAIDDSIDWTCGC